MKAPVAKKIQTELIIHGDKRIDNYYWLNNRNDQGVIDYIQKENSYCKHILKPTKKLQERLFVEMKSRMREEEISAPFFKNGYWYYERFEKQKEHPIYCRKKESVTEKEEILIDCNVVAKAYDYYELVSYSVSPDNKLMAITEDITGRRLYRIRIKNLETNKFLNHEILNTSSDLAWHNDSIQLFYGIKDTQTLRPHKIECVKIDSFKKTDIYHEKDDTYILGVSKSKDCSHVVIGSYSTTTTEFRYKSADNASKFKILLKRKKGHEYYPEILSDSVFIKSNFRAPNFKFIETKLDKLDSKYWKSIVSHNEKILLEDFEIYKNTIVIQEKKKGLSYLRVINRKSLKSKLVPPFEETYTMYLGTNPEYDFKTVRIGYSSLTTPQTTYDIDLKTFEKVIAGQTKVLGGFKSKDYKAKRVWAKSHDGELVPISLVYHKDHFSKRGKNPLLLYGYGSYGSNMDAYFSSARLSLLNRGFVFAIAHIRGGEELGNYWYKNGKMLKKKNTFLDFIACAEFLLKEKYVAKNQLYAMGGSAGGLLMGAISNMRPDLWKGIVSNVPFVDVVTTMLDESIPLTTGEYDEWGNPNDVKYYKYMKSYSPYDNLTNKEYPAMLVTSGLHDSQVQYWEPTKYVAKIRELKVGDNPILLYTNMKAGHGGSAGRFEHLKEIALEYAFLIALNKNIL